MLGTLTPEQKKDWKSHVPALVHAYNCTRNAATGFSPYFLLFGREPRLPVDVEFGLQRGSQRGSPGKSNYISQLRRRLNFAHRKARHMAQRQQARHRVVRPQVARAPKGSLTQPPGSPPPAEHSAASLSNHSSPESSSREEEEASNEEEEITYNTGSLTSHTTASSSSSADMLSAKASKRTHHTSDSITESQFSSVMPYTEDTGHTSDSVFVETSTDPHDSQHSAQIPSPNNISNASNSVISTPIQPPVPRRSTRSTKGIPPVCYGNVITHCTRITNLVDTPTYRQTLFVSCMPNIILG